MQYTCTTISIIATSMPDIENNPVLFSTGDDPVPSIGQKSGQAIHSLTSLTAWVLRPC